MELHAENRIIGVADAHNLAVLCDCRHLETIGKGALVNRERVISRYRRRFGTALEELTLRVEPGVALLAVHKALRVCDRRAESGTDCLMTEAHAEYREPVAELLYNVDDNACVLGTTRTRGEYDSVGVELPIWLTVISSFLMTLISGSISPIS